MSDLKPCPFCGASVAEAWVDDEGELTVTCNANMGGCGASIGYMHIEESDAEAAWNRRINDAELTRLRAEHDALVERLRGLMTPGCKWISAADLERVLNAPPGNTPRG